MGIPIRLTDPPIAPPPPPIDTTSSPQAPPITVSFGILTSLQPTANPSIQIEASSSPQASTPTTTPPPTPLQPIAVQLPGSYKQPHFLSLACGRLIDHSSTLRPPLLTYRQIY